MKFEKYIKMIFDPSIDTTDCCSYYENQYKYYVKNESKSLLIPEYLNNIASLVYLFYRDVEILYLFYNLLHDNYGFKNNKFDWKNYLGSIGWDNNASRLKYINIKEDIVKSKPAHNKR